MNAIKNMPASGKKYTREELTTILAHSRTDLLNQLPQFDYPPPMFIEKDEYMPGWKVFLKAVSAKKSDQGKQLGHII